MYLKQEWFLLYKEYRGGLPPWYEALFCPAPRIPNPPTPVGKDGNSGAIRCQERAMSSLYQRNEPRAINTTTATTRLRENVPHVGRSQNDLTPPRVICYPH
jgi:hypothetical protein